MILEILQNEKALFEKLQNFHFNVTGEHFFSLHAEFQREYEVLEDLIDELAETYRQTGEVVPTAQELLEAADIPAPTASSCYEMAEEILNDHLTLVRQINEALILVPSEEDVESGESDEGTKQTYIDLLRFHKKAKWFFAAFLTKEDDTDDTDEAGE